MRRVAIIVISILAGMTFFTSAPIGSKPVQAAGPIVVTGTADDAVVANLLANGECDLREAIQAANTNLPVGLCAAGGLGLDTITFNISGAGPHAIAAKAVFSVLEPLNLDATTAEFATSCNPIGRTLSIEVKPESGHNGDIFSFASSAPGSTIAGFVINGATGAAIRVFSANNVTVRCNHLGTDVHGGLRITNGSGVFTSGSTNITIIGGSTPSDLNIISGGTDAGIKVTSGGATIRGNHIGTNLAGTAALRNQNGIVTSNTTQAVQIGGLGAGEGNLISGNAANGVTTANAANVRIEGNRIGTTADGLSPLANSGNGVKASGQASTKVSISRNRIAFNGGLGIQLGESGPGTNDAGDLDTGPNGFQNYPTLTSASPAGIKGNTSTFATGTYTVELFRSPTCDPSEHGEGLEWFASLGAMHENANFSDSSPMFGPGFVTATATDETAKATSDFSLCFEITPDVDCDGDGDAVDALAVLRKIAGLTSGSPAETGPCIANVNGDATTDVRDALYIRRFAAGL